MVYAVSRPYVKFLLFLTFLLKVFRPFWSIFVSLNYVSDSKSLSRRGDRYFLFYRSPSQDGHDHSVSGWRKARTSLILASSGLLRTKTEDCVSIVLFKNYSDLLPVSESQRSVLRRKVLDQFLPFSLRSFFLGFRTNPADQLRNLTSSTFSSFTTYIFGNKIYLSWLMTR